MAKMAREDVTIPNSSGLTPVAAIIAFLTISTNQLELQLGVFTV
jgi:hypothetical protein